jgi:hypothetical protein
MNWALAIREWFRTLFGSRYVTQLEKDIDEARRERDYFRSQMERMQLLIGRPQFAATPRTNPAPGQATKVGSRRTWAEIQAENTLRNKKILEEQAAKAKEN